MQPKHISEVLTGPILPFSHKTRRPFSMVLFAKLQSKDIVLTTILNLEHYSCSKPETMPMPSDPQDDYLAFIQIFKACLLTHILLIMTRQQAGIISLAKILRLQAIDKNVSNWISSSKLYPYSHLDRLLARLTLVINNRSPYSNFFLAMLIT
jgi:hypothetical protein